MPGFFDALLTGLTAGATGLEAGLSTHDALKQREREQKMEEEERAEQARIRGLERALLSMDMYEKAFPKEEEPTVTFSRDTPEGRYDVRGTPGAVERARGGLPEAAPPQEAPINWQTIQTEQGFVQVNPRTGETRPVQADGRQLAPRPPASAGPKPPSVTESERRAAAVLPRAEVGYREIQSFIESAGGAPGISAMFSGLGGRYLQSEDVQRFRSAARAVVSSVLRWESGANITEGEINEMVEILTPQPGDKPETVQLKLQALEGQMGALRQAASLVDYGGSPQPAAAAAPPPAAGSRPRWQERADQLRDAGLHEDQIIAKLRAEGLIR